MLEGRHVGIPKLSILIGPLTPFAEDMERHPLDAEAFARRLFPLLGRKKLWHVADTIVSAIGPRVLRTARKRTAAKRIANGHVLQSNWWQAFLKARPARSGRRARQLARLFERTCERVSK